MDGRAASRTVAALAGLNVLSFIDRQLLAALAPLLIADLGLTKAEVGLLVGVAFMAVYAAGTLAVGVLADRWSRPRIVATGLGAWSAATALTATASGFASLALWRGLVGVGEATLPATALSMIGDRVPPSRVGLANGVFYAGVPVGFALSFALAAAVAPRFGWRACFLCLGLAGLCAVPLVRRMADPPRRGAGAAPGEGVGAARATAPGLRETARAAARAVASRPGLLPLILGGTLLVYASASSQHTITWLVEERGFPYARAALLSFWITLGAGLAGNLGIGALTDRARRRGPGGRLLSLACLAAAGLAATLAFYRLPTASPLFLPAWVLAQAWLLGWYGSLIAAIHEMAPAGARASVIGFALLVVNLLGVASGPYVTGLVGDRVSLDAGLAWSLAPAAAGAALVAYVGLAEMRRAAYRNRAASAGRPQAS
jgi:MFS family permease